jgi:uncharacterized protein (TIGR03118 family)
MRNNVVLNIAALAMLSSCVDARAGHFSVTNLVTNDQSINTAQITDSHLKNAWGISYGSAGPFWVSANGSGLSAIYNVNPLTNATTKLPMEVTIPGDGSVTGQVFNPTSAFNSAPFLFVSEDGTISGWRGATTAEILQTADPANIYKGVTQITIAGNHYLLSANFGTGRIDVLKSDPSSPDLVGNFTDPNLPAGYAPFNIQTIGGKLYVTYALQNGTHDLPGAGHGFVNSFDLEGVFLGRIATQGTLNSPWGLALAPSSFGDFAFDLLVGNFGDGRINAFDLATNAFVGQLTGLNGNPLTIDGLWALTFGNGTNAGNTQELYFSAGPNDEADGLFGVIAAAPETSAAIPEPSAFVISSILLGVFGAAGLCKRVKRIVQTGCGVVAKASR